MTGNANAGSDLPQFVIPGQTTIDEMFGVSELDLMELARRPGGVTVPELQRLLVVSESMARRRMHAAANAGTVRRTGEVRRRAAVYRAA